MTTHRPASFSGRAPSRFGLTPCRVSPVSLSRRRKPGCWVILFFGSKSNVGVGTQAPRLNQLENVFVYIDDEAKPS
ncbi:hypothetical protein, partial [Salisediminibacterium halotolerans]|uniref:hypothetical protein n=1 Tax=Salisediminibacterium halotolerans TaxID=517425 RepID=UPI001C430E91